MTQAALSFTAPQRSDMRLQAIMLARGALGIPATF
jgi:hypothetical protein